MESGLSVVLPLFLYPKITILRCNSPPDGSAFAHVGDLAGSPVSQHKGHMYQVAVQSPGGKPIAGSMTGPVAAHRPRSGREDDAFRRAHRHSGRVRLLKFMLPLAALLIIVGFVARSWLAAPAGVSFNLAGTAIENGRLVMADPKLDGFTRDNRAYKMTALRAIQDIGDGSRIDLEGIEAKLPFDKENWMTVAAQTGLYDREANQLHLDDEIRVVTDNGIKARLKSATVDIAAGNIDSNEPVDIRLDGAHIAADSLAIRDNGSVLIFDRRVRMEIDPKSARTGAGEGEGK